MGVDYHYHICRRTHDNYWREVLLYREHILADYEKGLVQPGTMEPARLDYGRFHELYSRIKEADCVGVNIDKIEGDLKNILTEDFKGGEYTGCYGLIGTNLADLIIYTLQNPEVEDYEVDVEDGEPIPKKENPVIQLVKDIIHYIELVEDWHKSDTMSDYMLISYCDH